jgi:hypothetical protein
MRKGAKNWQRETISEKEIELKVSMVNIMASLNDRICVAAQLHITALTLSCPESASHQSISTVDSRYAFCTTLIETQSHTDLVNLLID